LFILLIPLSNLSFSQIEKGVKIVTGAGSIHSSNLNRSFERNKGNDPYLVRSDSYSRNGINAGLGFFLNYPINNKLTLSGDITMSILSSHLYVNYFRDSATQNKGMDRRITSESKINIVYLNIPVMLRYSINKKKNLYVSMGLSLGILANPHLHTKELSVVNTYQSDIIDSTYIVRKRTNAVLDKHKKLQLNFLLGVEKRLNNRMKNFSIGLIYQIPLTRSQLYSSGKTLNYTLNNRLLGQDGKQEAEQTFPHHKLNDFRMSSLSITVKYTLKKRK
jgi:hypothetical protein